MPPFGLKTDAVPGRINETWTYVPAEFAGQTFYGQCSELCGTGHAFMPIMIKMVSKEEFQTRSEEHTSELQSLMRISYAVFCLKKKKKQKQNIKQKDNKHTQQ